ncbi:short transient receptor potential channel 7-like [Babylonia areolata]|uniref:short transient receptor potential channel 7-like n=1 Tax=Babylonia areolata TaxID=304850 RepID=UPI003FD01D67
MSVKSTASGTWRDYRYEKLRRGTANDSVRYADPSDPLAPRTTRDKRGASRLNLSNDKNRSLSSMEEDFIFAAEFGDIPTVQRVLEENPNFSVDYNDILGRTPLRLAVGNEHLEVVELLLDRCNLSTIHEALLQAISAGHEQIAETVLKHPKYQNINKENKRFGETDYFYTTTSEDSPFSSDITPLILAAEKNQFEIVQLLLLRGETIPKPHHYYCHCQECANKLEFDQLRLAKTRLNAYKGLASGAYISLSSKDPVLTAFELARELRQVAKVEKYYKTDYLHLADQLSEYVVKLLDKIRGHDELQVLLNKTGANSEQETYELLARLKLAIRYREKKFVAHPSCQQKLVSIWYADLRTLERSNWFKRAIIVLLITVFYPVLAICYWFAPKTKVGEFLRCPCVKFIGQTMSFVTFLLMILISTAMERPSAHKHLSTFPQVFRHYEVFRNVTGKWPADFVIRTFQPEIIHLLITLWIVGMVWQEIKQLYGDGLINYFDSLYNYLDTFVLTFYVISFSLRYVVIAKVNFSLVYFQAKEPWDELLKGNNQAQLHLYWLIADRFYWDSFDPQHMAEACFALANIISFARVSFVLPANELFGPMQISLARMVTDILKFGVIFLVLFLAFLVGLHNLYWYYPKRVRRTVELFENNITTNAEQYFGIPDVTFRTVFWSMLGRGEPSVVELGEYENHFIQNVGYWFFGVYNCAIVIVLLNMLIAMMSQSFEIIQAEADTEWKFARTKLYMEYISGESTLPVPFNIVPSPKCLLYFLAKLCSLCLCCCQKDEQPPLGHPGRIKDIEMFPSNGMVRGGWRWELARSNTQAQGWEMPELRNPGIKQFQERMATTNGFVRSDSDPTLYTGENLTYKRVMKRIVKRYIFDTQRESENKEVDIDELKQDISSFRYEMLNQLALHQDRSQLTSERLDLLAQRLDQVLRQQDTLLVCLLGISSSSSFSSRKREPLEDSDESAAEDAQSSSCSTTPRRQRHGSRERAGGFTSTSPRLRRSTTSPTTTGTDRAVTFLRAPVLDPNNPPPVPLVPLVGSATAAAAGGGGERVVSPVPFSINVVDVLVPPEGPAAAADLSRIGGVGDAQSRGGGYHPGGSRPSSMRRRTSFKLGEIPEEGKPRSSDNNVVVILQSTDDAQEGRQPADRSPAKQTKAEITGVAASSAGGPSHLLPLSLDTSDDVGQALLRRVRQLG